MGADPIMSVNPRGMTTLWSPRLPEASQLYCLIGGSSSPLIPRLAHPPPSSVVRACYGQITAR